MNDGFEFVDPTDDPRWHALSSRHGSLFNSPPWLRAIRDGFGVEPRAHMNADASAGFVLGLVDDEVGPRSVTFPFSDYCGPVNVQDTATWEALAGPMLDGVIPFRIRSRPHAFIGADRRLLERQRYAWHGIDLHESEDEHWALLRPEARQNVRRARREGVVVSVSSERSGLARFEELHRNLRRTKFHMLSQPPEYFDALHDQFGRDLVVLEAAVRGRSVAAVVLLRWGRKGYYKFNASTHEASPLRANDLLMWEAMRFATVQWKCTELDLGLSDLDQPGLLRYKAKYATQTDEIISWSTEVLGDEKRASAVRARATGTVERVTKEGTAEELLDASRQLYRLFC